MNLLRSINLALRFLVELCALAALGYWGFQIESSLVLKLLTGIGLPLLTAVAWGMFIAPKAVVRVPVWLWLLLQAAIFVAAGYALYASRRPMLAGAFLLVVVLNSVLLSMWRDKGVSKATLGM